MRVEKGKVERVGWRYSLTELFKINVVNRMCRGVMWRSGMDKWLH